MPKIGSRIKKIEELEFGKVYVFGYADDSGNIIRTSGNKVGHIMLTQPFTLSLRPTQVLTEINKNKNMPAWVFRVAESTGRGKGLVQSDYEIMDVDSKGIFKVWRGSQQEEMRVQIYRVWGF